MKLRDRVSRFKAGMRHAWSALTAKASVLGIRIGGDPVDQLGRVIADIDRISATNVRRIETYITLAAHAIGSRIASLPLDIGVWSFDDNGRRVFESVPDSELAELWDRPNPSFSASDLINWACQSITLAGETYFEKVREGSRVVELWPLISYNVTPILGKQGIASYEYKVKGTTVIFQAEDIIGIRSVNVGNPFSGSTMIEPLQQTILANYYLRNITARFLKNNATPGGVLTTEHNQIDPEVREEIKREWSEMHGGPDNSGRIALLLAGTKYESIQQNLLDESAVTLRNMNRDEILAAYEVPPIYGGDFARANFANAKEQRKQFWEARQGLITLLEEGFRRGLRDDFEDELWIRLNKSGVEALRLDLETRSGAAVKLVRGRVMTINEARAEFFQFPALDGGNELEPFRAAPGQGGGSDEDPESEEGPQKGGPSVVNRLSRYLAPSGNGTDSNMIRRGDSPETKAAKQQQFKASHIKFLGGRADRNEKHYRQFLEAQKRRVLLKLRDLAGPSFRTLLTTMWIRAKNHTKQNEIPEFFLLLDAAIEGAALFDTSERVARETVRSAGQRSLDIIGLGQDFSMGDYRVDEILLRTQNLSHRINLHTFEQIKALVGRAVTEGSTPRELAFQIRQLYDGWTGRLADTRDAIPRSLRIARTESTRLIGAATQLGFTQSRVVAFKQWLTIQDVKTRDGHSLADFQIQKVGEPFLVGPFGDEEPLMFPGDSDGSPGNVINCRCASSPIVDPALVDEILEEQRLQGISG